MGNLPAMEVVAAVVYCRGRILACQRPEGKPLAGFWEFPGGKVEPGETLKAALQRELREELAIEVTVLDEMYCLETVTPIGRKLRLHFIRALLDENSTPAACENQQFKFLAPAELNTVQWLETDRKFVEFLQ